MSSIEFDANEPLPDQDKWEPTREDEIMAMFRFFDSEFKEYRYIDGSKDE